MNAEIELLQAELEQARTDLFSMESELSRLRAALLAHCPGCEIVGGPWHFGKQA